MSINDSILWANRRSVQLIALLLSVAGAMPAQAATVPDLALGSLTVLPASVSVQGNLSLSAMVTNTGGAASNTSTLRYYWATDTSRSNETQVCEATIDPLAVAASSSPPCALNAPSTTGTYYFWACVDPDGSETNTTNNCTGTVGVSVTAASSGCQTSVLSAQQSSSGTLATTDCREDMSDGSTYYYDPYEFSGTAGQQIVLRLASTQFDPYVLATTPSGDGIEDDNSGGGTTSQLTLTLSETGKFLFRLSSAFPLQTGAYTLSFAVLDAALPGNPVVEYYHSGLDHYFITANATEASGLDNNPSLGWKRTGNSFTSGGNSAVCRFYGSMSPGPNSHFYTVDAKECADLKVLQANTPDTAKRWNFESLDFRSTPPVAKVCASGLRSVYRAYNNGYARGVDSNHRISASQSAIQEVVARGWIEEGTVMCAPL